MSYKDILSAGEEPMKKTVERMKTDFTQLRTGRASAALVDHIKVESYGSLMALNQLANVGVSEGKTIEIKPWDLSQIQNIEKAIQKSELGLTPVNDGKVIRLTIPALTQERRADLVKVINKMAEDFRISIRNERRQIHEKVKNAEKEKKISEDDRKKAENELQKITDAYVRKIDEIVSVKETEIKEV
jgi:ribosome recycling factor